MGRRLRRPSKSDAQDKSFAKGEISHRKNSPDDNKRLNRGPAAHKSHSFGPEIKYLSDFNCDGERDIIDVTLIQRQVTGLELYKHAPTASVDIVEKDGRYYAQASSSFLRGNVKFRYWITGGFNPYSYFDEKNMGSFSFDLDPDFGYVPGGILLSTGFIDDDCVELPLDSITKDEMFTLTITAKDPSGKISTSESYNFFNASDK